MPLTFHYSKIENYERLLRDRHPDEGPGPKVPGPELETFILLMMPMGVSHEVTAANVGEFWARLDLMQRMQGAYMSEPDPEGGRRDVYFTADDVIGFIGLTTNVSTRTRANFVKAIVTDHMNEQVRVCTGREKAAA